LQISTGSGTAAVDIAAIAQAVAGASPANAALIAATVAGGFTSTLPAAAATIADQVAQVSGLGVTNQAVIDSQAAIAKAVATAVTAQAKTVVTTVLSRSLNIDSGVTTPNSVAATFAAQIPAQAAYLAGTATAYLVLHPSATTAGDIAVSVATAPNVLKTVIPAIATEVATAMFTAHPNAIGGIADSFAYATTQSNLGNGNLTQANYATNVAAIATNLANVAKSTAGQTAELAGIVVALTEGIGTANGALATTNAALIATVAKNVATVAATYLSGNPTNIANIQKDLVGYLVARLVERTGSSTAMAGSFLATLRTSLISTAIPQTIVDQFLPAAAPAATANTVNLTPYTAAVAGAGIGDIGDALSQTTPVTPF
jgi:hypothetical protein